jgi:hypothetical protein
VTDDNSDLPEDAVFELAPDDPRRTDNRGGLEKAMPGRAPHNNDQTAPDAGATQVDRGESDETLGAAGSGEDSGRVQVNTTGLVAPDAGLAGAGATEGSNSGATEPQAEMTTVGVVDTNAVDASTPGEAASPKTPVLGSE